MDIIEQWNKVDMDFLREFLSIHNKVCCKKKTQKEFNTFVLDNKDRFDNPNYLQVFVKNVVVYKKEFYEENFDMCKVFYDFMQNNPDWNKLNYGLANTVKLDCFEDDFKEFLRKKVMK